MKKIYNTPICEILEWDSFVQVLVISGNQQAGENPIADPFNDDNWNG